jgi:hypothetical protein
MIEFTPIKTGLLGGLTANLFEVLNGWLLILLFFNSDRLY